MNTVEMRYITTNKEYYCNCILIQFDEIDKEED